MIHGVFGKLGAGKGLVVIDIIASELVDGFRDVVTNVPVRVLPWVNGQMVPQIGLRAYLLEKCAPLGEDEIDEMLKRVYVNEDIEQGHDLYLNRRDGDTGEWFKLGVSKVDEKGRPERFDAAEIKRRHCSPCLVVIDEAWAFFPNNGGYSRDPILKFYSKQQRKLRDECYIVTQHPSDCDDVFWKIAQDFWVCRNHGMERMGIFRQPAMFRVIVYLTNPAKGGAIRSHEIYKRLDKKLAQCYDTTAGVGFSGGHKGDAGQKRKGLHIAWLLVGVVILIVLLALIPHLLGKGASSFLGHQMVRPKSAAAWAGLTNNGTGSAAMPLSSAPATAVVTNSPDAPQIFCRGYSKIADVWWVFLSDGRSARSDFGEVQHIQPNSVTAFGHVFEVRTREPDAYVPSPDVVMPQAAPSSAVDSSPHDNVQVTFIGQPRQQSPVFRGVSSQLGNPSH